MTPFTYHEKQKNNQCGRHAINNALGDSIITEQKFCNLIRQHLLEKTGLDEETKPENVSSDPESIVWILNQIGISSKSVEIANINEIVTCLGGNWLILGNIGLDIRINSNYSIVGGHFIALRKDKNGNWWIVDSLRQEQIQFYIKDEPEKVARTLHPDLMRLIVPLHY